MKRKTLDFQYMSLDLNKLNPNFLIKNSHYWCEFMYVHV